MNIENLKMILETIESMGGDAKEFGIWFLIVNLIPNILLFTGIMLALYMVKSVIYRLIATVHASNKIAEKLGFRIVGTWTLIEEDTVLNRIRELIKFEKEHK